MPDNERRRCQKCGRYDGVERHHIMARQDGGQDDDSNLIDLCSLCHREWHIFEEAYSYPFDDWLQLPPMWRTAALLLRSDFDKERASLFGANLCIAACSRPLVEGGEVVGTTFCTSDGEMVRPQQARSNAGGWSS